MIKALEGCGLAEIVDAQRSLNDNQYIHSQWAYKLAYEGITALRPNLQLELIARNPVLPTETASIRTLADKLAGHAGATFSVPVISVAETLAEKVLSFLRRYALYRSGHVQQNWDNALVRHIYDVHCILSHKSNVQYACLAAFSTLTAGDVKEFGYQDEKFATNPGTVLKNALSHIEDDAQLRDEYNHVLLPLVYGTGKFSFDEALGSFKEISRRLIAAI